MSIPKSFLLDIGGKELLWFEAVLDLLKCIEKGSAVHHHLIISMNKQNIYLI